MRCRYVSARARLRRDNRGLCTSDMNSGLKGEVRKTGGTRGCQAETVTEVLKLVCHCCTRRSTRFPAGAERGGSSYGPMNARSTLRRRYMNVRDASRKESENSVQAILKVTHYEASEFGQRSWPERRDRPDPSFRSDSPDTSRCSAEYAQRDNASLRTSSDPFCEDRRNEPSLCQCSHPHSD